MTGNAKRKANKWLVLLTACLGLFMIMVQGNVINVALSKMQADFGVDIMTVQWVTSAYILAFTMLLITMGRLGDAIGRKKVFMGGLAAYTAGCLLSAFGSGMAGSAGLYALIAGAVVQGIGGAAMMPATQSLIAATFAASERGMALGIWGATSGLAVAIGPALGGVFAEYGLGASLNAFFGVTMGWRYIYFFSALWGVSVFLLSIFALEDSKDESARKHFDVPGVILSSLGIFLLVFAINKGGTFGWWNRKTDFVLGSLYLQPFGLSVVPFLLVAALIILVSFVLREIRLGEKALMDMRLFGNRDFTAGAITTSILSFAMMGTSLLVPMFLQGALKFTPIQAGLSLLPMALAVIVASPFAGKFSDRFGSRWVVAAGLLIMTAGSLWLARFSMKTTIASMVLPFVVEGLGIGLAMSPITAAALRRVPRGEVGGASGLLSMIRQFGSVLGVTVLVTVFSGAMTANGVKAVKAIDSSILSDGLKTAIANGMLSGSSKGMNAGEQEGMLKFFTPAKREKVKAAMSAAMGGSFCDSINYTFLWASAVSLAGFGTALFLSGKKKEEKHAKA